MEGFVQKYSAHKGLKVYWSRFAALRPCVSFQSRACASAATIVKLWCNMSPSAQSSGQLWVMEAVAPGMVQHVTVRSIQWSVVEAVLHQLMISTIVLIL
jgi:hypothetical protein